MTSEPGVVKPESRGFVSEHRGAVVVFAVGIALAAIASVYVFWWYTQGAQSSGLVPATLSLWTTGNLVWFILYLIGWELILIGIPVVAGLVAAWGWWRRLPEGDRRGWPPFGRGSRRTDGSAAFSFLLFVAFCIKVYLDGNWNVPIATFTVNYVVGSVITILAWGAAIVAIPAIVALAWWVSRKRRLV
jgi:hypothetical protein